MPPGRFINMGIAESSERRDGSTVSCVRTQVMLTFASLSNYTLIQLDLSLSLFHLLASQFNFSLDLFLTLVWFWVIRNQLFKYTHKPSQSCSFCMSVCVVVFEGSGKGFMNTPQKWAEMRDLFLGLTNCSMSSHNIVLHGR